MRAFIPNRDFSKEASESLTEGIAKAAGPLAERAEQIAESVGAPWMPRSGHDLVEVVTEDNAVFVVNTDYGAHLQEFGSVNNPPHAPLRRAASEAGMEVDEST